MRIGPAFRAAAAVHDDDVSGPGVVNGLEDHHIVAGLGLDGKGRSTELHPAGEGLDGPVHGAEATHGLMHGGRAVTGKSGHQGGVGTGNVLDDVDHNYVNSFLCRL